MKKIILTSIAISAACLLQAQEIVGKIDNYNGETIKIVIGGCDQEELKISPSGDFTFHPIIRHPNQNFTINLPDQTRVPILVGEGQKVNVHFSSDGHQGTKAEFSGDLAAFNTYLYTITNQLSAKNILESKPYTSYKEYGKEVDRLDKKLTSLLNKVKGYDDLVKEYRVEQKVDVISTKIGYRLNKTSNPAQDTGYEEYINSINLNDNKLYHEDPRKGSLGYMGIVERVNAWKATVDKDDNSDPKRGFIDKLEMLDKLVKDKEIRNAVANYYSLMYFMGGGNEYVKDFAEAFYKVSTDEQQIAYVKERSNSTNTNPLAVGAKAPDFDMFDQNGKLVRLSDLKGKLVYVDVWATWCGPCVGEIPFMNEAYQKYKNDDRIAFISISIDHDKDKWNKKLEEDKPEWQQYIVEGASNSTLCKEYLISGIPRFMLFDADGNIININEKRPSHENFISYIEEQLEKPKEITLPSGMKMIKLGADKKK